MYTEFGYTPDTPGEAIAMVSPEMATKEPKALDAVPLLAVNLACWVQTPLERVKT